jgi:hypothetical protein
MQDLTQLSDEQLNELEENLTNEVAKNDIRHKAIKLQMNGSLSGKSLGRQ